MQKTVPVKTLVVCALLAGMYGILAGPLSVFGGWWKVSLAFVPICLASLLYGPVFGGMTGFAGDLISVLLIARSAYNPVFAVSAVLTGVLPWVVFKLLRGKIENPKWWQAYVVAAVTIVICSIFLNTLWLALFVETKTAPIVIALIRVTTNVFMVPIHASLVTFFLKKIIPRVKIN